MLTARPEQKEIVDELFEDIVKVANGEVDNFEGVVVPAPCGFGKTYIIRDLIMRVNENFNDINILVSTESAFLVEQNYSKLLEAWPIAPAGIFSAKLKEKSIRQIIVGNKQSIYNSLLMFPNIHILIIDECHNVDELKPDTVYIKLINELKARNPNLIVIGLSGTPFRKKLGYLWEGKIFSRHTKKMWTEGEAYLSLIEMGRLCPLICKETDYSIDVEGVPLSGDDFNINKLERRIMDRNVVQEVINDAPKFMKNRNKTLAFFTGVDSVELAKTLFLEKGYRAAAIHSRMDDDEQFDVLNKFKENYYNVVVAFGMMTTGVDINDIDCMIDGNPTCSIIKARQKWGRLTRMHPSKLNGLVADYAKNIPRNGAMNDDEKIKPSKGKKTGIIPVKLCENKINGILCNTYNPISAKFCCDCGNPFEISTFLDNKADNYQIIKSNFGVRQKWHDVVDIEYEPKKIKKGNVYYNRLFVHYKTLNNKFTRIVCFEEDGNTIPLKYSKSFWSEAGGGILPFSLREAMENIYKLKRARKILVHHNHPTYPNAIINQVY